MVQKNKQKLKRFLQTVDNFQQKHSSLGFPYAVIKKYGDDEAAYEGALITYYGFLSIFPLLIVLTSFLQIVLKSHEQLHHKIITSLNTYFPVIGNQIEAGIHSPHKSGLALLLGLLFMLYGARGVADAFRHAMDHVWQTPKSERPGFPAAIINSLKIIVFGGVGLIAATSLSSFATSLGRSFIFRIMAVVLSVLVLYVVLTLVFTWAAADKRISYSDFKFSALVAAIGIQILQIAGGFIITHQLKNLSTLYGTFALVLGILFWIYLQSQIVLYSIEIDTVRKLGLWPRSITQNPMTEQDQKAYKMYPQKERFHPEPPEKVRVNFQK